MANTTLTAYVGLTPADAELMFDKLADVQPHWKGRWGLKATPVEAIAITFFFFGRVVMIQHISIKTEFIFAAGHYEMPRHGSQRRTCEGAWSPRNQVHDQGHCSLCGGYAIKEKFCIVDV